uniref:Uncharacterized protein n=1 Tax=Lotus japonicus TaxID=34305 RepID=I3SN72_LOTJA|nr:unknown [Lotus japonicus]
MAFERERERGSGSKGKRKAAPRSPMVVVGAGVTAIAVLFLVWSVVSTSGSHSEVNNSNGESEKYLYWGNRIDCPGKHCGSCEGLGHQESSLRCALEEAIYLRRTFVMPSRMCINPIHNKKGILHRLANNNATEEEQWVTSFCAMDSLYDLKLISQTVPVILENSREWHMLLSTLEDTQIAHVQRLTRIHLKQDARYSHLLLINRTASPLSWFMECKIETTVVLSCCHIHFCPLWLPTSSEMQHKRSKHYLVIMTPSMFVVGIK